MELACFARPRTPHQESRRVIAESHRRQAIIVVVMVAVAAALLLMTPCRRFLLHRSMHRLLVVTPAFMIAAGCPALVPVLVVLFFFRLRQCHAGLEHGVTRGFLFRMRDDRLDHFRHRGLTLLRSLATAALWPPGAAAPTP